MSFKDLKTHERRLIIITIFVLILLTTIDSIGYFFKKHQLSVVISKINEKNELLEKRTEDYNKIKKDLLNKIILINNLKQQNGNSIILKTDIKLYILKYFQKIPKSVATTIAENVVKYSNEENVSPEIVMGIIEVESRFNPSAKGPRTKSKEHARGLMQVMPEWVPKMGLKNFYDLYDIDHNINSGIKIFKIHMQENDNDVSKGLYYYVNRDKAYVNNVYKAMGKFVTFRSNIQQEKPIKKVEKPKVIKKEIKKIVKEKPKVIKNKLKI